ncbi:MAG: rod shape-determining protein RodA [Bacteroidia bacterium]|nr:rod shape-determining protein RodA [Bacteroidia bacterium]
MRNQKSILQNTDPVMLCLYLALVIIGWLSIYGAVYNEEHSSIFDLSQNYGKQLMWIGAALLVATTILIIDGKFYATFSYGIYAAIILLLIVSLVIARKVKGAEAWIDIGSFKLQPSELAKFASCMALAKYLSSLNIKMQDLRTKIISGAIIAIPLGLTLLQNDTGSALVFISFIFLLYREGLSGNFLLLGFFSIMLFVLALLVSKFILIGIFGSIALLFFFFSRKSKQNILLIVTTFIIAVGIVLSVNYVYSKVLQEHQRTRIDILLGTQTDLKGAGYNVNQSKIAIGSGGFFGKGFLQGTQTKYDFVPEQSTDFIFCTVGEDWGFIGTFTVVALYMALLMRILYAAERQRSVYTRIYGYGVASIIFFHVMINIGMTIGLAPVIGIPLPFLSYGGSSLLAFTVLLFIFIRLDAYRMMILR